MSYTVFALKWRPQGFDQIVGQDHIVNTLKNAIKNNRLGHAYLFAGPRGVGKTSTARILAKAINCKSASAVEPCQECISCKGITQGSSLDVIEIDGASNRGIDEIRTLRESAKFAPAQGKFKIYIIDEIHMLTEPAFNALLKTLEEPPAFVKFIFATTHPDKIPPTILSRCQRFDFRRITATEIVSQLERICASEKISIEKEVLFAVAKASDGALRDAESILDQLVAVFRDKISLKDVIDALGLVEQESLFGLADTIIHKDANAALKLFNSIFDSGKDTGVFLNNLIEHFRNLMVAKITGADAKLLDLPQETRQRLLEQSAAFTLEELFVIFNTLVSAQEMAKRLDSARIPLEISIVKLANDKKNTDFVSPSVRKIDNKGLEQNKETYSQDKVMQKEKGHPSTSSENQINSIDIENVKGVWASIIETIGRVKMSVATYLNEGVLVNIEKNILTISFPKDYSLHKESLDERDNKELIEKAISEASNNKLKVNFILSEETAVKDMETDVFLKSAMDMFNGKVIRKD